MLVETRKFKKKEMIVVSSRDVAETFGKEHKHVLRDIRQLECSEEFRQSNFEQSEYINQQNHKQPMYYITRDGFTILAMGYSGEKAMQFKEAYIKQFNAMEELLKGRITERERGIVVRQAFTEALKGSGENERTHGHAYSLYTDMIYKEVFGKNAKQLREAYGIMKQDNLRNLFSQEELAKVKSVEMVVSGLVNCGWGYEEIKEFITNGTRKLIAAS